MGDNARAAVDKGQARDQKASSVTDDLSAAIEAMKRATHTLVTATGGAQLLAPADEEQGTCAGGSSPAANADSEHLYRSLEETGQLVDVGWSSDLTTLPPDVTHVRLPDGTVKRIGFTAAY